MVQKSQAKSDDTMLAFCRSKHGASEIRPVRFMFSAHSSLLLE
jgi:hypothetical protein